MSKRNPTKKELQQQVEQLSTDNKRLSNLSADEKVKHKQTTDILKKEHELLIEKNAKKNKDAVEVLNQNIKKLDEEKEDLQDQLDDREIKKLAEAYADQESAYKDDADMWARRLLISGAALFTSVIVSLYFSQGKEWFGRLEIYLVDFIFISAVWFCAAQYSYYVKLRTDFSNRKTLAQAYHNILNTVEDTLIQKKFVDKAIEVWCAKTNTELKESLPTEKL